MEPAKFIGFVALAITLLASAFISAATAYQAENETREQELQQAVSKAQNDADKPENAINAMCALAKFQSETGKIPEAELTARRALETAIHTTAPASPQILAPLLSLSSILMQQEKYPEAEYYLRQAMVVAVRPGTAFSVNGEIKPNRYFVDNIIETPTTVAGSRETASVFAAFAHMLLAQGRLDDSERLLKRVLEIYEVPSDGLIDEVKAQTYPARDLYLVLLDYTDLLKKRGDTSGAETRFKQAQQLRMLFASQHRQRT